MVSAVKRNILRHRANFCADHTVSEISQVVTFLCVCAWVSLCLCVSYGSDCLCLSVTISLMICRMTVMCLRTPGAAVETCQATNALPSSRVIRRSHAWTGINTDRQAHTHTHRQSHRWQRQTQTDSEKIGETDTHVHIHTHRQTHWTHIVSAKCSFVMFLGTFPEIFCVIQCIWWLLVNNDWKQTCFAVLTFTR